jgi:short subunit dehydrogenase-like uncharacterized protein
MGTRTFSKLSIATQGKIKWAMAGRNKEKLEATRVEISKYSPEMANVPILLADLGNKESLDMLATSTNVVICMAGPYTLHGTPVVQVRNLFAGPYT